MPTNNNPYKNITAEQYDAFGNILKNKGLYNESKGITNGDYNQYATAAQPYYQTLRDTGMGDLADVLSNSTYEEAAALYAKYANPTTTSGMSQQAIDSAANLIGQGSNANINTVEAATQSNDMLERLNNILQPNQQESAALNQSTQNLLQQLGIFTDNNTQTQAQSQNLLNQMSQFATDQSGRYDNHYDWLKTHNPFESDMARSLLGYYDQQGNTAAGNAIASGGANNAGNIDSYSAANANRQQLAFKNAGANAVTNQYNAQTSQMLGTLQSLGVDVNAALQSAGNVVANNQNYNLGILGNYTAGDTNLQNVVANTQNTRNQALADSLGKYLGLYETNANNASTDYGNQLNAATNIYGTAMGADTARHGQETQARTDIYGYDTQRDIASANNEAALNQLNAQLASNERLTMAELQSALQRANISAGVSYSELSNAYKIASEKNASNERITSAELANALEIVKSQGNTNVEVAKIQNPTSTSATTDIEYNYGDVLSAYERMRTQVSNEYRGRPVSNAYIDAEAWDRLSRGADKETQEIIKQVKKIHEDSGGNLSTTSNRNIVN